MPFFPLLIFEYYKDCALNILTILGKTIHIKEISVHLHFQNILREKNYHLEINENELRKELLIVSEARKYSS